MFLGTWVSYPGTRLTDTTAWEFYTLRMQPVGSNIIMTKDGTVTGNVASSNTFYGPSGFGFNYGQTHYMERSDFLMAELIAYDRALSDEEIQALEYVRARLEGRCNGAQSRAGAELLCEGGGRARSASSPAHPGPPPPHTHIPSLPPLPPARRA